MEPPKQEGAPKRKVLFVVTKSNFGGAQRYVYDLATSLPSDQFEPVVMCGSAQGTKSAGKLIEMLSQAGIRTIYLPELNRDIDTFRDLKAFSMLWGAISLERPDVLHLNSSKAGGLGALAGRLCGVRRIVFTAHGWAFAENRTMISRALIHFASWLTVVLSHITICVSESDHEAISRLPLMRGKTRMVHNGIDEILFLDRLLSRQRLFTPEMQGIHKDDVWVTTNAEMHPNKNLILGINAVRAANSLPGPKIFYALMSDGEERGAIERHIQDTHSGAFVSILGFVPDARQYLTAFDIFFLPSKKEGLPYALLEAGAAGLPVIASRVGGIPEIIEDNVSGRLHTPDDVEAFAHTLRELADDATLRARLGDALKATVAGKFPLTKMLQETIALY